MILVGAKLSEVVWVLDIGWGQTFRGGGVLDIGGAKLSEVVRVLDIGWGQTFRGGVGA